MKNIVFALVALMAAPSLALAGGDSKDDPTLTIRNQTDTYALVVIDDNFTQEMLEALEEDDIEDQIEAFEDAGGYVLEPGGREEVELSAGSHTVYYYYIEGLDRPDSAGDFDQRPVTLVEGIDSTLFLNTNFNAQ